jgi:hypothetical protein
VVRVDVQKSATDRARDTHTCVVRPDSPVAMQRGWRWKITLFENVTMLPGEGQNIAMAVWREMQEQVGRVGSDRIRFQDC